MMAPGCHGVSGVHVQRLVVMAYLLVNVSVTLHDMADNLVKVWQKTLNSACYQDVQV